MATKDTHQDNAQTKPQPKKRQPVKNHDPQAGRIASTLVIIGCLGAAASAVLMYRHFDTALVWVTFGTVTAFLAAIYFHWRNPSVQALCFVIDVLLFIGCVIWQYEISMGQVNKTAPASPSNNVTTSAAQPSDSPSPSPSGRKTLDIDPKKLLGFFEKYNSAQAQKLVETYIGKWMEISGEVSDVERVVTLGEDQGPSVMLSTKIPKGDFITNCDFDEQRWVDRAVVLRRGERVTLFGRITRITERSFTLERCEFVE